MEQWRQRDKENQQLQRALYRLAHPLTPRSHNKIKKNCLYCDKEFWVFPSLTRVESCSRACAGKLRGAAYKGRKMKPKIRACKCCERVEKIRSMGLCNSCVKGYNRGKYWRLKWFTTKAQFDRARERSNKYAKQVQADPVRRRVRNLKANQHESKRRAIIKGTRVGRVSYERILQMYGMVCNICGEQILEGQLSFDHVIPIKRGGTHTEDNLRPAHTLCNIKKGAKLPGEVPLWRSRI